ESGFATPDPVDNNIIWSTGTGSGSVGGSVARFDERNHQAREVEVWPEDVSGATAAEVKYRFNWEFPITISPHDHNKVYVGSQYVHVTTDGGNSWQMISPDLTRNDKSRQQISGGRSEEHTSELQSPCNLVCRLLVEIKCETSVAAGVRAVRSLAKRTELSARRCASIVIVGCSDSTKRRRRTMGTAILALRVSSADNP